MYARFVINQFEKGKSKEKYNNDISNKKNDCSIVLTEDLNDGQIVDNVKIQNPLMK